ncbi:MAG: hypothetical protein DHS20C15_03770 [Planctomycetota bacterium]|nr:MAG: hypothetical protein DHS20C15_03770 [Planctomycetota bacterium]
MASRLTWIIILLGLALFGILGKDVVLGLDLAGGASLRFALEQPDDSGNRTEAEIDADVKSTVETLRTRIDSTGMRESTVTQQGGNEIVVELPGSSKDEAETVKSVISRVGNLLFVIVLRPDGSDDDTRNSIVVSEERAKLVELLAAEENQGRPPEEIDTSSLDIHVAEDGITYRWYPHTDEWIAQDRLGPDFEFEDDETLADVLARTSTLTANDYVYTRLESDPEKRFTGADIANVRAETDSGGGAAVGIEMRADRAGAFANWTGPNEGRSMGLLLDGRLPQPPATINEQLGQRFIIQAGTAAGFSQNQLNAYITVVKSGSLKMKPKLLSQGTIGPSLGESSINAGMKASLFGFLAVLVFMIVYYRFNGLIAGLCLLVNMTLLAGVLMFLGATITLPGIAGLVLTLGMAVDANILIFERIREESDRAKSPGQAVKLGFEKATSTILDANITSFVTAMILYNVGSGPVRGFAVILMLGILTSVFSVLVFGRVIYDWLVQREKTNLAMRRLVEKETAIPFMSKARGALTFSAVLVVCSLIAFSLADRDKYGLDFTGGYKARVRLSESVTQGDMLDKVRTVYPDAQVISVGGEGGSSSEFVIKIKRSEGVAEIETDDLQRSYEEPLKEALDGIILPDFATEVAIDEDLTAQASQVAATLHFESGVTADDLRPHLASFADLELGDRADGSIALSGRLPLMGLDESLVVQRVLTALSDTDYVPSKPFLESGTIGARVGTELRDSAWRAIILSFIAIVLYIRVRFREYRYGIAAIVALAHDVSITLGVVALMHFSGLVDVEIDLSMIAAFLTIIGYSLNDTIVLFDRVRENLPRLTGKTFPEVLDISINQTLSRTLLTSMTTLTALVIIFIVNYGEQNVLEGFSFAMILGVLVGTYSSIFVASPVLTLMAGKGMVQGNNQAPSAKSSGSKQGVPA